MSLYSCLIQSTYQWIINNNMTPYMLIYTKNSKNIPLRYIKKEKILLNISPVAVKNLEISNNFINFDASFSKRIYNIFFPIKSILSFYSFENKEGLYISNNGEKIFIYENKKKDNTIKKTSHLQLVE